jgi:hypothetical protein
VALAARAGGILRRRDDPAVTPALRLDASPNL